MSRVYENWERLVSAVMKKQQLWELFHQHSRTPSTCSESSSTSFNDVPFDFSRLVEELKIKKASTDHEESIHARPRPFTFRELAAATEDFRPDLILSEGGFGRLYKGRLKGSKQGTYGYCAPEYAMTGRLTVKADVYSYGVVLLEIITGRKAIDNSRAVGEINLVLWAHPLLGDRRKFVLMADTMLQGRYPIRGLYQALATCYVCLQTDPDSRPSMADVAYSHKLYCFPEVAPGCGLKPRSCMLRCCCRSNLGIETWSMNLLLASSNSML